MAQADIVVLADRPEIGIEIPLAELYADIDLTAEPEATPVEG